MSRSKSSARRPSHLEHPVALGSFRSWLRVLRLGGPVDREFLPRLLFVCSSTLFTSPLRLGERVRYGEAIRRTEIHPSPIFIIGHWRSGTTFLHHLLCQDRRFGYLTTFQAMAPGFFLIGRGKIRGFLEKKTRERYPTRLIDNVPLLLDAPEEDEFALANMSPYSFLHAFTFPRQARYFFKRYVLFEGIPQTELERWVSTYLELLRKVTLASQGRRLVLKNCANTARIRVLLRLFPEAKFIHIYRNPYRVFVSTLHLHGTVLPRSQLQRIGPEQVEANVLEFYERLMKKYLADRHLIPAGSLVEVRFEELERSPLDQLRRIYEELGLPEFAVAEPAFRAYLRSVAGYRKNTYRLDVAAGGRTGLRGREVLRPWGWA
mgnify:CR=1 FL=1